MLFGNCERHLERGDYFHRQPEAMLYLAPLAFLNDATLCNDWAARHRIS